jgi:hypothetical protein|mmetsp:Transcript_19101/g.30880  ORF Transcript_19101/g.30880 Transcript_19101/m.30880 type:complete len:98 (+) Transcript_19101:1182-1475(+)
MARSEGRDVDVWSRAHRGMAPESGRPVAVSVAFQKWGHNPQAHIYCLRREASESKREMLLLVDTVAWKARRPVCLSNLSSDIPVRDPLGMFCTGVWR